MGDDETGAGGDRTADDGSGDRTGSAADAAGDGPPDGEFVGVVDRFEGDLAVVLLERDAETVGSVAVPRERLPADARRPDAVLGVTVADGRAADLRYDAAETDRRRERAQSRFDRLSSRRGDDGGEGSNGRDAGGDDADGDDETA